jgi:hypothetical protein
MTVITLQTEITAVLTLRPHQTPLHGYSDIIATTLEVTGHNPLGFRAWLMHHTGALNLS